MEPEKIVLNIICDSLIDDAQKHLADIFAKVPEKDAEKIWNVIQEAIRVGFMSGVDVGKHLKRVTDKFKNMKINGDIQKKYN